MRLIDADALLEQLSKKDSEVHIGLVMQLIDSMPTFQREERDKLVTELQATINDLREKLETALTSLKDIK